MLALASQRLSLTAWYRVDDLPAGETVIGDENNKHLGIVDARGNPKPAFHAFRLFRELFGERLRLADSQVQVRAGPEAIVHVFEAESGDLLVAAWLRSSPQSGNPGGRVPDAREETFSATLPIGAGAESSVAATKS